MEGPALVALGSDAPVPPGRFRLDLPTGLVLEGFSVDGREVLDLRAWLAGQEVEAPPWCRLLVAREVPSVSGGPADPAAWDRWFGELGSFTAGGEEARARARKAAALPSDLADLYARARTLREAGPAGREELLSLRRAAERFPSEWLLHAEVAEIASA